MQKYKVKVKGENLMFCLEGEHSPRLRGFFTYRVIYADNVSEVESKTIKLIMPQLKDWVENIEQTQPIISILQIEEMQPDEDDSFQDMGFVFYLMGT